MLKKIMITGIDHFGRGIAHDNNKVIFVENALPGEIVDIEIIQEKKNYIEAKVKTYHKKSEDRVKSMCPYYDKCGGCNLLHMSYQDTLNFKYNKVKELLSKNKINYENNIEVIANDNPSYYRNKASFKIVDGKIGYYESKSNDLVEIKKCMIVNPEINKVLANYTLLGIKNGMLTVRVNSNNEVLIILECDDKNYQIEIDKLKTLVKLVGIVYNRKVIYGNDFYYERIGGFLFKVSFNSFFQVNPYICEKLFKLVDKEIEDNSTVIDLYSGVGTLSMVASKKAKQVLSVEIVKNAVLNGIFNAKLNKQNNIQFLLGDTSKTVLKLKQDFDTLILDPPRSGLDKNTISFILDKLPRKIIYVSCDANTLMRDLKLLENKYQINDYKILDMFSYSYHLENFVVLNLRG